MVLEDLGQLAALLPATTAAMSGAVTEADLAGTAAPEQAAPPPGAALQAALAGMGDAATPAEAEGESADAAGRAKGKRPLLPRFPWPWQAASRSP